MRALKGSRHGANNAWTINRLCSTSCASIAAASRRRPGRGGIWLGGAAAAAVAAAALAAWWWTRPGAIPVHVVAAQAIAGDGAVAAGSILDASGYVVARRQATVASKITAKMVELDIEEGDRVKAGQVIARLDDTNIRAALNESRAQRSMPGRALPKHRSTLQMRSAIMTDRRA